jgi:hypothetical protein
MSSSSDLQQSITRRCVRWQMKVSTEHELESLKVSKCQLANAYIRNFGEVELGRGEQMGRKVRSLSSEVGLVSILSVSDGPPSPTVELTMVVGK